MSNELEVIDWAEPDAAFEGMQSNYIAFCIAVAKIGDRQKDIAERYGMSRSAVAQHVVVGNADPRIVDNVNNPKDTRAVYGIASAHKKHGEPVLVWLDNQSEPPKRKDVNAFIKTLEPEPVSEPTVGWMAEVEKAYPNVPGWKASSLRSGDRKNQKKIEKRLGKRVTGMVTREESAEIVAVAGEIILEENPKALAAATPDVKLSLNAQQKVDLAIRKRTAELQQEFKDSVDAVVAQKLAEKQKELDAAIARYKKLGNELKEKNQAMDDRAANLATIISEDEYKRITSCLHPDRHPGEEEKYNKAMVSWRKVTHSSRMEFTSWTKNVFEDHGWSKYGATKIMREKRT